MTEAEALEKLTQRFLDVWPGLYPTVKETFEGEALDAPDGWVRVTFIHTVRRQVTMGSDGARKYESRGNIFVQLFGPTNVGVKQLAERADAVRTIFEGRRFHEDLTTYAGSTREAIGDGRWAQRTVVIPFIYEELR